MQVFILCYTTFVICNRPRQNQPYCGEKGNCKSWTLDSGLDRGLDYAPATITRVANNARACADIVRLYTSCSIASPGSPLNLTLSLSLTKMEEVIVISSDSDDDVENDPPVLVFTPTKRPSSPETVYHEDRYVHTSYRQFISFC